MMKSLAFGSIIVLMLGSVFFGQEQPSPYRLERPFVEGRTVRLMLASGDYQVSSGASDRVVVRWEAENTSDARDVKRVKVRVDSAADAATIRTEGPTNHVRFTIEVPARSHLFLRMMTGDMRISGIEGNKDLHMTAGDLNIDVLPESYSFVHASVTFGDLKAGPLGISKDGIRQSFDWAGSGKYTLHASMFAGDLNLNRGKGSISPNAF